ncbi:MAG: hypothetical protein AAF485_26535, partial [Chloroflexota bacterium]
LSVNFGNQIELTGYALGDASSSAHVNDLQTSSNDLLWLRLGWEKIGEHPENLKVSALVYNETGQLITQVDKLLVSNILQVSSKDWDINTAEATYFLIPIPAATPPGIYTVQVATYGDESLARLPIVDQISGLVPLDSFTINPATAPINPEDLDLSLTINRELWPGLTLVGFETLPGESIRSGDQLGASLIWQAGNEPLNADLGMGLIVKEADGDTRWPLSEPIGLAGPHYPSSQWQAGEVLRGWLSTRIPPTLEPGTYSLILELSQLDQSDGETLELPIGNFEVEGWQRNFEPPQPHIELDANFDNLTTLIGLDSEALEYSPGDTLNARLHWRVDGEFTQNFTAFIHLIGPDGLLYGQVDQTPGAGAFPTSGWLSGEYIADSYSVPIDPNAPLGDYLIEIGMYDPNSGQRLSVTLEGQTDDKILLPGLTVK